MRQDIREVFDPKLANAIKKHRSDRPSAEVDAEAIIDARPEPAPRVLVRKSLIETQDRDPNALERVIGRSDLCSVNFLLRGFEAGKAVARIRVRPVDGSAEWYGTGFLVAPGMLLTNHHVLADEDQAALAVAEFNFEHDLLGVQCPVRAYNLTPSRLFFTDGDLDCTFVAVAPRSFDGMPLAEFGYLPLMPQSGKALDGEWVSMIQHPGGQPKQIAIRDSQIKILSREDVRNVALDHFIHYTTDSEPGSSGAPVFNDQWQVVALHHRGVPDFDEKGQRLARDGKTVWTKSMGDEQKGWVANEGVRVSALYDLLRGKQFASRQAKAAFDLLRYGLGIGKQTMVSVVAPPPAEADFEAGQGPNSTAEDFEGIEGYDQDFLSKRVTLPKDDTRKSKQAKLIGKSTTVLKYTHFSVVFDTERRFARFTAVNIDGNHLVRNSNVKKKWRRDGRIDVEIQADEDFYKESIAEESVVFQRGHLVRRVDPSWGSAAESKRAVEDTFHYTNAAPHVGTFNDTIWGNLEDYLLDKCDVTRKRMTVFSGPIFRSTDPSNYGIHRPKGPYTIPVDYWKVAVIQKTPTTIAAAGFIIGHGHLLDSLEEERVFSGLHPFTPSELVENGIQTTIENVEEQTGLSFGNLKDFDSVAGLEATFHARKLRTFADIII